MTGLIYIGNGAALVGVPARDLTEEEALEIAKEFDIELILKSGLYKRPGEDVDKKPRLNKAKKESD